MGIIERFRRDNERNSRFYRISLQVSGIILGALKLLCAFVQIAKAWVLPMHFAAEPFLSSLAVVFLEVYSCALIVLFSFYVRSNSLQENTLLTRSVLAVSVIQLCIISYLSFPDFIVPLWLSGGSLLYAFVILYADSTLKNTTRDIEK